MYFGIQNRLMNERLKYENDFLKGIYSDFVDYVGHPSLF